MLDSSKRRLAILAALAALAAAGCGGDPDDPGDPGGAAVPATTIESTTELPTSGGSSGDPECQSRKDPETGRYLPTPEKCHLQVGE